jgi:hypothetical protein
VQGGHTIAVDLRRHSWEAGSGTSGNVSRMIYRNGASLYIPGLGPCGGGGLLRRKEVDAVRDWGEGYALVCTLREQTLRDREWSGVERRGKEGKKGYKQHDLHVGEEEKPVGEIGPCRVVFMSFQASSYVMKPFLVDTGV